MLLFRSGNKASLSLFGLLKSFYLDPTQYKSFYWVLLTRFMEQMGLYTTMPFFQYFIQDVIKVKPDSSERLSSLLLGTIVIASIPASIISDLLVENLDLL